MQFNPQTKKLEGSGEDSGSGIDTVNQTTTGLIVKDKAGSTSQFSFTTKTATIAKITTQTMTITSLKYNSETKTIPKTILIAAWTADSTNAIKYLRQTFAITKQEGIVALYDASKSKTTSLEITKGSNVTKTFLPGLVLIKLKSKNGGVVLAY